MPSSSTLELHSEIAIGSRLHSVRALERQLVAAYLSPNIAAAAKRHLRRLLPSAFLTPSLSVTIEACQALEDEGSAVGFDSVSSALERNERWRTLRASESDLVLILDDEPSTNHVARLVDRLQKVAEGRLLARIHEQLSQEHQEALLDAAAGLDPTPRYDHIAVLQSEVATHRIRDTELDGCIIPWEEAQCEREPDLIEEWHQPGVVSLFTGPPDSGKTMAAVGMASSIAAGGPWLGSTISQGAGPVIYWGAEDSQAIPERIAAHKAHFELSYSADRLHVVRNPAGRRLTLSDTAWVETLLRRASELGASLIVIDTLSLAGDLEDENGAGEVGRLMARLIRLADESGAHVMVLHHPPKGGSGPRGSGALLGAARQVFELVSDKDGTRLKMTKNNNGPKSRPKSVEIVSVLGIRQIRGGRREDVGVMVLDTAESAARAEDDEVVLDLLRTLGGEDGLITMSALGTAVNRELEWKRSKLNRWRDRMAPQGRIEYVKNRGVRLPQRPEDRLQ